MQRAVCAEEAVARLATGPKLQAPCTTQHIQQRESIVPSALPACWYKQMLRLQWGPCMQPTVGLPCSRAVCKAHTPSQDSTLSSADWPPAACSSCQPSACACCPLSWLSTSAAAEQSRTHHRADQEVGLHAGSQLQTDAQVVRNPHAYQLPSARVSSLLDHRLPHSCDCCSITQQPVTDSQRQSLP